MSRTERPLLVTGAGGLVGGTVLLVAERSGTRAAGTHRVALPPDGVESHALDLLDEDATQRLLDELEPWGLIHCAAAADTGACEDHPEWARKLNAELPARLAALASEAGVRFVFLSTDLVFDGRRGGYAESDSPRPISVYGRTKLSGEQGVLDREPLALVVRTSIQYGGTVPGKQRQDLLIRAAIEAGSYTGYVDEFRSPIHCEDLAASLLELARGSLSGILHVAGPSRVSRYDFAVALARVLGLPDERVVPGQLAEFTGRPARAPDTSLDTKLARELLKTRILGLDEGLALLGAQAER